MISTTAPRRIAPRPLYPKSLAASSNSAGRMRLPPPSRRYSPISVIAVTLETVSRPNSRSMAERSSRNRSKISFCDMVAGMLNFLSPRLTWNPLRPVIGELHINAKVGATQQGDDFLQRVAVFAAHPHGVSLNRGLHFLLRIFNRLDDLARLLHRNALLHGDLLPHGRPGGRFHDAIVQRLDGHAALDQLRLQD